MLCIIQCHSTVPCFAFRIKFKLVSLVAGGLYDLVLQPHLPPFYFPPATASSSRLFASHLSTTVQVIPTLGISPLLTPLCLANSYSPYKAQAKSLTLQVQFSIKIFTWASLLLTLSPTMPTLPTLWETLWLSLTHPNVPGSWAIQSEHTVNFFEWMSDIMELMNEWYHGTDVKKNDNSHRVRFSNKLSQVVLDSDQMRGVKRPVLHLHQE